MNFKETHFKWYDTIGDLLEHSLFQNTLIEYKKLVSKDFPNIWYENSLEWDIIRDIFMDDPNEPNMNFPKFMKLLRKNIPDHIEDIKSDIVLLTTLILSIEQLKEDMNNSPCTILELVSTKITDIINISQQSEYYADKDWKYYKHNWIQNLLDLWFPCINVDWEIVYYFHSGHWEKVRVIWEESWSQYWMDWKWNILLEEVNENDIDPTQKKDRPSYIEAVIDWWKA